MLYKNDRWLSAIRQRNQVCNNHDCGPNNNAPLYYPRILGLPPDFKEGVLFSTYATLVSTLHKGKVSVHLSSLCPKWSAHFTVRTIGNCISILCYIHAGTCQILITFVSSVQQGHYTGGPRFIKIWTYSLMLHGLAKYYVCFFFFRCRC